MIKVVIDTNVVVSGNLVDEGPSAAILDWAANHKILMFTSPVILAEYEEVLRRPRLKLDPARIAESLAVILKTSTEVVPIHSLKISKHAADNRFYECADVADADYVISGDMNRSVNTQSMIFSSCLIVYPSITQLRSFEPGEDWGWCYVDQVMRELSPIPEA